MAQVHKSCPSNLILLLADVAKADILAHIDAEIAKDKLTYAANSERCAKVQEEIDERQEEMSRLANENGALSERIACWTKAKEGVQAPSNVQAASCSIVW